MVQMPGFHGSESLGGPKPVGFNPSKRSDKQKYASQKVSNEAAANARLKARDAADAESKGFRDRAAAREQVVAGQQRAALGQFIPGVGNVKLGVTGMHTAVAANKRQFGTAGTAMKGALGKLRTAKRLGSLLRGRR